MYETYYDSAEDTEISRARALKELENHGVPVDAYPSFFAEMGYFDTYQAQKVLDWLGY